MIRNAWHFYYALNLVIRAGIRRLLYFVVHPLARH
ncbi:DUF3265 domain-containing protein [Photobacterium angustum]|nr:DUF3265 domain-containing protein [Photobacterium angustum]PSV95469.1 DUF3265 domain-containing protein [Photobacterium angustum]PSW91788.1 DUF3265 domain-containing protein [Photobacterium angustum]